MHTMLYPAPWFSQNFVRFLKFLSAIESGRLLEILHKMNRLTDLTIDFKTLNTWQTSTQCSLWWIWTQSLLIVEFTACWVCSFEHIIEHTGGASGVGKIVVKCNNVEFCSFEHSIEYNTLHYWWSRQNPPRPQQAALAGWGGDHAPPSETFDFHPDLHDIIYLWGSCCFLAKPLDVLPIFMTSFVWRI